MRAARPLRQVGDAPRSSAPRGPGAAPRGPGAGRLAAPLAWGASVAVATGVVAVVDPHVPGRYPACPLLALTGLACPLCGALRATHDLAHLDVAGALAANPWWVVVASGLVAAWAVWTLRAWRSALGRPAGPRAGGAGRWPVRVPPRVVAVAVGASAAVFGVARNVPALGGVLGPGG